MMVRTLAIAFALIAACLLANAAEGQTPVSLWRVEGESNTIYLLGSVHLLRQSDYPLPNIIDRAYADAEELVMELDMDDLDPIAMQTATTRMGMLPEGETLESVLGKRDYAAALTAATQLDIPFEMLAGTEPWYAAIMIEQLVLGRMGFNPQLGLEMVILTKAVEDGKEITGLETVEEQLGFLDGLSADAQRAFLMQTLEEADHAERLMNSMITAWKNGDVAKLESEMLSEFDEHPELYRAIVADRNRRWLGDIEPLLRAEDDYLVLVGALHLVGDDGLPTLLEQRGHKVTQLSTDSVVAIN